jgi:4a-hydroxytetrahydrobiopterin dehydratase
MMPATGFLVISAKMNGMAAATKYTEQELQSIVSKLPGWAIRNGKLHREFRFSDFAHAVGFMTTAAVLIEKKDHHPEWSNVYNRVFVDLTTHDAGGVTHRDVELAELLDKIATNPF